MITKQYIASSEKLAAAEDRGRWSPVINYKILGNRQYMKHGRWVNMDNEGFFHHYLEKEFHYNDELYGQQLTYTTSSYEKLMKCYTLKH